MAKKQRAPDEQVKARVLTRHPTGDGGTFHAPDDVLTAPASVIKDLEQQGIVDSDDDAVAYAESLKPAAAAE